MSSQIKFSPSQIQRLEGMKCYKEGSRGRDNGITRNLAVRSGPEWLPNAGPRACKDLGARMTKALLEQEEVIGDPDGHRKDPTGFQERSKRASRVEGVNSVDRF